MATKGARIADEETADNGPINADGDEFAAVTTAPVEWEFETVSEESGIKVIFDNPEWNDKGERNTVKADVFIGQYLGTEDIVPENSKEEPFTLFSFRGRDGRLYSLNTSYKLNAAMQKVKPNDWCRITYVKNIATGRAEPLKDFRVEVKKA
jgi:hypothetical protein